MANVNGLRQQRSFLSLSSDALALAVSTVLRLVDPTDASTPSQDEMSSLSSVLQLVGDVETVTACTEAAAPLDPDNLPEVSLDQVSWHDNSNDCWIVVYDRVYDVTEFLFEHPGGEEIILEYAGRDATLAFRGSGHTVHAWRALDKYLVGQLPPQERIYKSGSSAVFENAPLPTNLPLTAGG